MKLTSENGRTVAGPRQFKAGLAKDTKKSKLLIGVDFSTAQEIPIHDSKEHQINNSVTDTAQRTELV